MVMPTLIECYKTRYSATQEEEMSLEEYLDRCRRDPWTFAIAVEQHRTLLDAIGRRQGARAESLAREHADLARRVLESASSDTDALSRVPGGALITCV